MCNFFAALPTFDSSVSVESKGNIIKVSIYWANEQRKESKRKEGSKIKYFSMHQTSATEQDWYESNANEFFKGLQLLLVRRSFAAYTLPTFRLRSGTKSRAYLKNINASCVRNEYNYDYNFH